MALFFLLMVGVGVAYRVTTPDERARLLKKIVALLRQLQKADAAARVQCKPFHEALCARTRWPLAAAALLALNVTLGLATAFRGDPQALVAWGASFGPRTTNGEWWRLVTSLFVHASFFQLVVAVATLASLGFTLERLIGTFAFVVVYFAAGVIFGIARLSDSPVTVIAGSSGALWGLYGVLLVWLVTGLVRRSPLTMPLVRAKRLAPAAALFLVYSLAADGSAGAIGYALAAGLVAGCVLLLGITVRKPQPKRIAALAAAAAAIAVAFSVPVRGIIDVRPDIAQVVAMESRTAGAYNEALERFKKGRITIDVLAQTIDRTIMPPLEAADAKLKTFTRVPAEQQPLVADATQYVTLRRESWRLRAAGLRKINERSNTITPAARAEARHRANNSMLGKAEECERESLEALERIKDVTN
jgi:membrane associated rhomboid family serine protease